MLAMFSTAGDQSSTLMMQLREQAITAIDNNKPGRLYFAEWSPPPEIDPGNWRACAPWANPALGTTVTWDALEAAYDGPDRQSFMRAHLNLWIASAQGWLPHSQWAGLQTNDPMPAGGVLAVDSSVDGLRFAGVRAAVQNDGRVRVATEFVVESETAMWQAIEAAMADPTMTLAITPGLELHTPLPLRRRMVTVGYGELQKWTALVRGMIMESRLTHNGEINLAEHLNRAVMVKSQNTVALSSQKSPGPIELARCTVWAAALASRPATKQKPALATG